MSSAVNIVFVISALLAVSSAKPKPIAINPCGANMQYKDCGTTCPAYCNGPKIAMCNFMCKSGCFCDDGFVLDKQGGDACVLAEACPKPKPENENVDKCAAVNCVAGDVCKNGECISNPDCPMFDMSPPKPGCEYVQEIDPINNCPVPVEHCPAQSQ